LDGARRLSQEAGLTAVTFYDIDNVGHMLTIPEATSVAIQVSNVYQSLYKQKQQLMRQAALATTVEELPEVPA
jgi:hypothetical protein